MLHGKRHRRRDAFFRGASDFVLTEGAAPPQTPPSRPSASEVKHASLTPAASRQPPRGRLEEDSRPPPNRGAKTVLSAPTLVISFNRGAKTVLSAPTLVISFNRGAKTVLSAPTLVISFNRGAKTVLSAPTLVISFNRGAKSALCAPTLAILPNRGAKSAFCAPMLVETDRLGTLRPMAKPLRNDPNQLSPVISSFGGVFRS